MNDDGNKILVCNFLHIRPKCSGRGLLFLKKKREMFINKEGGSAEMGVARIGPGPRPAHSYKEIHLRRRRPNLRLLRHWLMTIAVHYPAENRAVGSSSTVHEQKRPKNGQV